MPRRKRKIKSFYIDTNVALDYITKRNVDTIIVLEGIKEKGWRCVSSTFLAMEMADYKKDALFVADKVFNKKWEIRKILRESYKKQLKDSDFENIADWFEDFKKNYKKIEMYDFLQDEGSWELAQDISFNSNLAAPDVIHLTSAIWGSIGNYCDIFMTNDKLLIKEAEKIIEKFELKKIIKGFLKIMTVAEVKKKYFTKKK